MLEHPSITQVNRTGYPVRHTNFGQSVDYVDRCGCGRRGKHKLKRQWLCEACAVEGGFL